MEVVSSRITFDPNPLYPKLYTLARAEQEVIMCEEIKDWIRQNDIRIVNMSWSYARSDIETSLIRNGVKEE